MILPSIWIGFEEWVISQVQKQLLHLFVQLKPVFEASKPLTRMENLIGNKHTFRSLFVPKKGKAVGSIICFESQNQGLNNVGQRQ